MRNSFKWIIGLFVVMILTFIVSGIFFITSGIIDPSNGGWNEEGIIELENLYESYFSHSYIEKEDYSFSVNQDNFNLEENSPEI